MAPLPDTNPILEGVRWKYAGLLTSSNERAIDRAQVLPLRHGPWYKRHGGYFLEICIEGEERRHDPRSTVPVQRRTAKSE
jgi:hypothetical protein